MLSKLVMENNSEVKINSIGFDNAMTKLNILQLNKKNECQSIIRELITSVETPS